MTIHVKQTKWRFAAAVAALVLVPLIQAAPAAAQANTQAKSANHPQAVHLPKHVSGSYAKMYVPPQKSEEGFCEYNVCWR